MAKEVLAVPEEHLREVIAVIREGLTYTRHEVAPEVVKQLTEWCDEEEAYLNQ